jgi:hypothetical protein
LGFSEKKFIGIVEGKTKNLVKAAYRRLLLLMMTRIKSIKHFLFYCGKKEDSAGIYGYFVFTEIYSVSPFAPADSGALKGIVFLEEIFYE